MSIGEAPLDSEIFAFDIAKLAHSKYERIVIDVRVGRGRTRARSKKADSMKPWCRLRLAKGRKRRRNCARPNGKHKLATSDHPTTPQAFAGGTVQVTRGPTDTYATASSMFCPWTGPNWEISLQASHRNGSPTRARTRNLQLSSPTIFLPLRHLFPMLAYGMEPNLRPALLRDLQHRLVRREEHRVAVDVLRQPHRLVAFEVAARSFVGKGQP